MSAPAGLLQFFHPDGSTNGIAVFGDACPPDLVPVSRAATDAADLVADLVVLAPSTPQAEEPQWLEATVRSAAARVAPDGLVYALVPPAQRRRVRREFRRAGLVLECGVLHVPHCASVRHGRTWPVAVKRFEPPVHSPSRPARGTTYASSAPGVGFVSSEGCP